MSSENSYWFKRKRYGWGWVPMSWQGWALTGLYLGLLIAAGLAFLTTPSSPSEWGIFLLIALLLTVSFIKIALKTAPSPKWRWGKKSGDDPDKDF